MRIAWINAALPALGLAVVLACAAHAYPRYVQETGKPCSSCHTDAGGHALTSAGREYRHYHMLTDMRAASIPLVADTQSRSGHPIVSIEPDPQASLTRVEPDPDGDKAGLLAMGFGLTSLCILAYRRSR